MASAGGEVLPRRACVANEGTCFLVFSVWLLFVLLETSILTLPFFCVFPSFHWLLLQATAVKKRRRLPAALVDEMHHDTERLLQIPISKHREKTATKYC